MHRAAEYLLLQRLEVVAENPEMAADHGLAKQIAPHDLTKVFAVEVYEGT